MTHPKTIKPINTENNNVYGNRKAYCSSILNCTSRFVGFSNSSKLSYALTAKADKSKYFLSSDSFVVSSDFFGAIW